MRPMSFAGCVMWVLGAFVVAPASTDAQAHEVRFVASYGSGNVCTREAPCKTLQRGINKTPAGGELIVLDSGDYGDTATIDKSITISAIGVSAVLGGGITINATDATVVLRGLRLNGAGVGGNGIDITTGETVDVYIDGCEVDGFDVGINVDTDAYPTLSIANSVLRNNYLYGLHFRTGTPGQLVIDRSRFEHNGGHGIMLLGGGASITLVVAAGNGSTGIVVSSGAKANISWTTAEHNGYDGYAGHMALVQSVARGNGRYGVSISQYPHITEISDSVLTNNSTGIHQEFGTILTRGNNTVSGNTIDVSGTLTPLGGM